MANEDKKDFNAMLQDNKGIPKIDIVTNENTIKRYGGEKMYFAPPLDYDKLMKRIPEGKLITIKGDEDKTPFWRTLKSDGELNPKYPESIELQKSKLEEGHEIIKKGRKNIKYY